MLNPRLACLTLVAFAATACNVDGILVTGRLVGSGGVDTANTEVRFYRIGDDPTWQPLDADGRFAINVPGASEGDGYMVSLELGGANLAAAFTIDRVGQDIELDDLPVWPLRPRLLDQSDGSLLVSWNDLASDAVKPAIEIQAIADYRLLWASSVSRPFITDSLASTVVEDYDFEVRVTARLPTGGYDFAQVSAAPLTHTAGAGALSALSRSASCFTEVLDPNASPCPLTDGKLDRWQLDSPVVTIDLGAPTDVSEILVRGAQVDGLTTIEVSVLGESGSYEQVGVVEPRTTGYRRIQLAERVTTQYVRLRSADQKSSLGLSEVSVF